MSTQRFFFILMIVSLAFQKASAQWETDDKRILHQYIVMLKPGHEIEQLQSSFQVEIKSTQPLSKRMNIWLLERNTTVNADEFLYALQRNEHIKLAQFNHRVQERQLIPNDTKFNEQWGMYNTGQQGGLPGADIEATEAWSINHDNVTVNGDTIVIAIIDGKFDLTHEDINYFVNRGEVPGNGIDDDGNGYIDDISGWDVPSNSGNINSQSFGAYHSTHCAGIAAAIGNNGKGVAGVCWGAKIMGINYGSTDEAKVVAAYEYAREMRRLYNTSFGTQGAFVVSTNSSFGIDEGNPADYPIWCAMYDSLGAVGIISAGAAPNKNLNIDVAHDIPTECPSNWLIGVTNITRTDFRNTGSGYGKIGVDLGAPGTGVHSTVPSPILYQNMNGTSMATPHVAGAVGAMYAAACKSLIDYMYEKPDSAALLIRQYILDAAEWVSTFNNITRTNGKLNLYRAIENLRRYNCDTCHFSVSIDQSPITCYGANTGAIAAVPSTGSPNDYTFMWNTGTQAIELVSQPPGFYYVMVKDSNNCRRYATTELHYPDSIVINSVNTVGSFGGNPGSITVVAAAGNDTLQYSLDGANYQSTPIFSVPTDGTYTIYVKNSLGCIVSQTVVVNSVSAIVPAVVFSVFPNPVTDELNIYSSEFDGKLQFQLFSAQGQLMESTAPQTTNFKLQTTNLPQGVYYIQIGSSTKKFAVVR